jgi:mono/diheme cytochrome c family protein
MKSSMIAGFIGAIPIVLALVAPHAVQSQDRPAQSADGASAGAIDGKQLFATSCGWCHQDGGRAAGRGPKLAGSQQSDEYLMSHTKTGKQGGMPAFGSTFSESQLRAIVAYIRTLKDTAQ